MEPFKSIVVDIDATAPVQPALERAVHLARTSGAKLTIVDVMTVPPYARHYLPASVEEELVSRRREDLARIASGVAGVPTESKLLVGRPATALIEEVVDSGHDLVVRARARDLAAPRGESFGAVDMELLRQCPCPVFLVGYGITPQHPRIVAAVNTSTDEEAEQALNIKIVELAMFVAEKVKGSLTLLHAWAPFAEDKVRRLSSDQGFVAYVEAASQRATEDFSRFAQSFGGRLTGVQAVLRRGEPEDVIPEFAVAQGIDLVVMGTLARSGIAGLLIGNTAERVLRKLPCSVLAVKPNGFAPARAGPA